MSLDAETKDKNTGEAYAGKMSVLRREERAVLRSNREEERSRCSSLDVLALQVL